KVEAPLGLHDVGEQAHHVAVLAVELQLHVGLVLLEVLGAHPWFISLASGGTASPTRSVLPVMFQLRRWWAHGPRLRSASWCSGAAYPLFSSQEYAGCSGAIWIMWVSRVTLARTLA